MRPGAQSDTAAAIGGASGIWPGRIFSGVTLAVSP